MNKELNKNFSCGHSACAGCAFPTIVRTILGEAPCEVAVANSTGCLEVTSTVIPYTAWKVPYIHSAFENLGATISGMEKAYKSLKKKGKIKKKIKFVAFSGDGGTYDIGLQALSGALERGHDFVYVVYDNGGYMNTGNQRSSATPYGASTETTPIGENDSVGKITRRKNLMEIVNAHGISYLAQANVSNLNDLKMKAQKAFATDGPAFLLVFSPCTNNWKFPTSEYVKIAKLATETNFWPLYEIENGKYKINWATEKPKPIEEFLQTQGRFKHLFQKGNETCPVRKVIQEMQKMVDNEFKRLVEISE